MSRTLTQLSFSQDELASEWEEAYNKTYENSNNSKTHSQFSNSNYNAIFSDDEDETPSPPPLWIQQQQQQQDLLLSQNLLPTMLAPPSSGYLDPVLSSSTYHIHQADNALTTLKQIALEDGWKKALKHKSGVVVHMKNGIHKGDKTPVFKGEAIIQGFSPQSIFYVIGMRKLWDEQYEDGNLIENLNDTTSLTYEVMKPTATSKSRDLSLVEKIECTQNGAIVFACTSVETPRIPRISGRTRVNTKLQGWILEPLHGPQPATKVIFVIQESMKGWVPGFAKKTLARRPLVIAKVADYLEKKTERMRAQAKSPLQAINHGHSRRPSVMSNTNASHTASPLRHFNSSNRLRTLENASNGSRPSPNLSQRSILVANGNLNNKPIHSTALTPSPSPPLPLSGVTTKKHISFAEHDIAYPASDRLENSSTDSNATVPPSITKEVTKSTSSRHLYPTHRHPIQKVESIQLLKKLSHSLENWKLLEDLDNGHKHYLFSAQFSDENDEFGKRGAQSRLSFVRADGVIEGGWTAEQICSVIHCSGSRKLWDGSFEGGHTLERFSQKEYLVQWILGGILPVNNVDVSAITTIEADPVTGTVYTASTSVNDGQIPPDESGHRIRAYTDLYGWVFKPKLDSQGRTISVQVVFMCNIDFKYTVPTQVLQTWIDTSLQSVQRIQSYLTQYGCPPYIRRVAGKIIKEDYDPLTHNYQITFTAKHQPSASYRSRKQHNHSSQNNNWCTDVRYNKAMFAHGLDIRVSPEDYTRIEVSPKDHRSIRIYTTDSIIEGKQVTFNLSPLVVSNDGSHYDYTTYRYNGRLVNTRKPKDVTPETEELSQKSVAATVSTTAIPVVIGDIIEKKKSQNVNIEEEDSSQNIPKPLKQDAQVLANESKPESTLTKKTHTPNDNINEIEEKGKGSPINEEESLQVPKGYVLVPEHQNNNNNIIIISDDLSFNGQQISVMFIAMVICYYMGKFTSCSC